MSLLVWPLPALFLHPRPQMSAQPDLFLVEAAKCGAVASAPRLCEHEDMVSCAPKAPFPLAKAIPGLRKRIVPPDQPDCRTSFEEAGPARDATGAEGSAACQRSLRASPAARDLSPDARFVAMRRDPAERAHGRRMEQSRSRNEDGERVFAAVPETRRLALLHEGPRGTRLKAQAVLGLSGDGRPEVPLANPSRRRRFLRPATPGLDALDPLKRLVYALRARLAGARPSIAGTIRALLCREQVRQGPSQAVKAEPGALFRPDGEKALPGRRLSAWKPGRPRPEISGGMQAAG